MPTTVRVRSHQSRDNRVVRPSIAHPHIRLHMRVVLSCIAAMRRSASSYDAREFRHTHTYPHNSYAHSQCVCVCAKELCGQFNSKGLERVDLSLADVRMVILLLRYFCRSVCCVGTSSPPTSTTADFSVCVCAVSMRPGLGVYGQGFCCCGYYQFLVGNFIV